MNRDPRVARNIRVHDKIADRYERRHAEIFNAKEQERLKATLEKAAAGLRSTGEAPRALDVGCGSGNLTRHLLDIGFSVVAADVSGKFLRLVQERYGDKGAETQKINGVDLRGFASDCFDLTAAYSVLHHIPHYLGMVEEMIRVTKPGGLIYLDHEKNERHWRNDPLLKEFYQRQRLAILLKSWRLLLTPSLYINRLRRVFDPRFQSEADLHVFPDDHVEWGKIKELFRERHVDVAFEEDYLLYNKRYREPLYNDYRQRTNDTKALVGRKQ